MNRRHFRTFLLVSLPFLVVLLLYRGQRLAAVQGPLRLFDRVVLFVTMPLLGTVQTVRRGVAATVQRYVNLVGTERENEELKGRIANLTLQQIYYDRLAEQGARLERLLEFQESAPYATLAAHVLSYPPLGEFRILTIDRGSEHGVVRGAAVLAPDGLIGRIFRVERTVSQVLLLVDPMSAVDARVRRTGARGLVIGRGREIGLRREMYLGALEFWERNQEVREGDQLVTSGLDGLFPPDLPVGFVRSLRRGRHEVFLEGDVIPAVEFHKLREVLVLKRS